MINDILHNCQYIANGRGAQFRTEFEKVLPEMCEELGSSEWALSDEKDKDDKEQEKKDRFKDRV